MLLSAKLARAMEVASTAHEGQYRKNDGVRIPYVSHVMAVGWILQQAGWEEEVVIAGLLHDVLEDTDYPRETLRQEFGATVVGWIDAVTEQDKALPWEERKVRYLRQLESAPVPALAIAVADKIHNFLSILAAVDRSEEIWERFTRGPAATLANFRTVLELLERRLGGLLAEEASQLLERVEKARPVSA